MDRTLVQDSIDNFKGLAAKGASECELYKILGMRGALQNIGRGIQYLKKSFIVYIIDNQSLRGLFKNFGWIGRRLSRAGYIAAQCESQYLTIDVASRTHLDMARGWRGRA